MSASLDTLKQALAKDGAQPVYLIQGAERLLVDEAVRTILTAAVGDPDDRMAVQRVDLADKGAGAKQVLGACRAMGLFASRVAVLVRAADQLDRDKDSRQQIADYLKDPNRDATLVLVGTKLDGKSALVKRLKKAKGFFSFDAMKSREVPGWLVGEARRLGHRLDMNTARLIGDLTGTDLSQLRLVMDQLSLYVGPGEAISERAVTECLASTRAHGIFELVDAVGDRRAGPALAHLHSMLEHKEAPLRILGMLIRHVRMLWQVQHIRTRGGSVDEVQRHLGIHPFQAKKLYAQADRFSHVALHRATERLWEADLRLKSKGLDDQLVMERLVIDLCG